jgi:hypothetical protein
MSVIDLTGRRFEVKAAVRHSVKGGHKISRDQEFRTALERYIADYEKHHAKTETANRGHARLRFIQRLWR